MYFLLYKGRTCTCNQTNAQAYCYNTGITQDLANFSAAVDVCYTRTSYRGRAPYRACAATCALKVITQQRYSGSVLLKQNLNK